MKPCALLKLDFLTGAYNKCIALVRKSSFSKAQGLHETGPWVVDGTTNDIILVVLQSYSNVGCPHIDKLLLKLS